jgi:plastocyanin domain-containing protein
MLNIFPWLRKFNIRMPKFIGQKIYSGKVNRGPFYVGLLNGFMPCGPLQSMQLYALGTGSFIAGATSMFFFSLGTVPLMFGLGALSTILSKKFTNNLLKFSAILVIVLGVGMISRGMSLSGFNTVLASTGNTNLAKIDGNVQTISIDLSSSKYQPITVQKGIPVRFIINAAQENINGCNGTVIIPELGIEKKLIAGENVIEFLPEQTGTIPYSCWMGMIRSKINVVDDITQVKASDVKQSDDATALGAGGSCCSGSANANFISDTSVDEIYVAKSENGLQTVNITVDEKGFNPNVIVLQKGEKVKFKFDPKSLNQCNNIVIFPEYGGGLDLSNGELETPELEVSQDFGFTCGMSMLNVYVKVVDDISTIDKEAILKEANAYIPAVSSGSGGCH